LVAWRRSSLESLRRAFLWPSAAGLGFIAILVLLGVRHFYALLSLGLCVFVAWTIFSEFIKGSLAIRAKDGRSLPAAMVELTHRNTRRYGGYIVHMGIVFMFIGFTGAAFNTDKTAEVAVNDSFKVGKYDLRVRDLQSGENDNYAFQHAVIDVMVDGQQVATLHPERRLYKASKQPTSEVAIRRRLNEDLYLNFAGMGDESQKPVIQAYVFPLVSWIWIGFVVLILGTLVCLVPSKVKLSYLRTETVGISRHSAVPAGD
jgi:cytochrome c-type biogenesis protein CcmF